MSSRRGQPPRISPDRYDELLKLLADGSSMADVAAALGVTRRTLYNLADRDEAMGARMKTARAVARALHGIRHGTESCYVNNGCRRPQCIAAATNARTDRRHRVAEPQPPALRVYDVIDPPSPPPLAGIA